MDNKLSELSKPVAWRYRYTKPGITDSNGEAWVGDWKFVTDEVNCNPAPNYQKCALYSQEYVSALLERIEELESTEIKPEGMGLMSEAIGAHGYIVGCLVQGRPDLAWIAWQASRELLANREAQPVAWTTVFGDKRAVTVHAETAEVWNSDGLQVQSLFTAPPAPAVPEEMKRDPDADVFDPGFMNGWNACRAAMLNVSFIGEGDMAQPVSGGYTLNSPEIPDGCQWTFDEHDSKWDSGCGEAWMFCDGGPTENGVRFCQSCGKPVLLAAAPEGGNG